MVIKKKSLKHSIFIHEKQHVVIRNDIEAIQLDD